MRQLNGLHAKHFNQRHKRCGHVFQARFRSLLVETDSYLLAVCRYVVLNPVRAGICERPEDWPRSHHHSMRSSPGNSPTPIARAYRRHGYTVSQIANQLGCSYSTISRRLRREEARLQQPTPNPLNDAEAA